MRLSHRLPLATLAALLSLVLCSNACAEDRRTDRSRLVVMSYNAEFLWDGIAPEEGDASFPWKGSQTECEEHMAEVADAIIRGNPDVVNLVEVENLQALTTFNAKYLPGRGYKPYLIKGEDSATGQDVALLTRIDPEGGSIARYTAAGTSGGVSKSVSKNYYAKLNVNGTKIALIGLHFLAVPGNEARRLQREAQADAMRTLARQLGSEYNVIVLGDFNDYDGAADARDHVNSQPISNVLANLRALDPSTPTDDLVNAARFVPVSGRYTSFWDQNQNDRIDGNHELTSIDHVLLDPDLAARVQTVVIPHEHDPAKVSDHFPVIVHLAMDATPGPPDGVANPVAALRISALLPNPEGDESENESVTLRNNSGSAINLTGWKLRDRAGTIWDLSGDGSVGGNTEKQIKRKRRPMGLNNTGDTVDLVDPMNRVVHSVTFGSVDEGELLQIAQ